MPPAPHPNPPPNPPPPPPPPSLPPPGCAACRRCKPNCPFRIVLPEEKSRDYQYLTLFFSKKNLEGMFRDVGCEKRKNVLDSIMYECKCRTAEPQFGCVGTLLELKQRCDYLERVVSNLLVHNQEVLNSTLACPESHPIDFYQSNHQVPQIPNIEGFGLTPIVFPPLLQEYLQAQNNRNNSGNNNNNSGFDGGNNNNNNSGNNNNNSGFDGGNNNNNSGFDGSILIGLHGGVPGLDGGRLWMADVASGSGLNDYSRSQVGFNHSGGDMVHVSGPMYPEEFQSMDEERGVSTNLPVGRT